jgi:hypothetical protein
MVRRIIGGRQLVALGHKVKIDPAGACKVVRTAQQDGCGRRGGYCEAAMRPRQRFVASRSVDKQVWR